MIKSIVEMWKILDSHIAVALVVGLGIFAWLGWHRPLPEPGTIIREIQTVTPGEQRVVYVPIPGTGPIPVKVPEKVTAPTPNERVIVVEKPVVVPAPGVKEILHASPESVTIHIQCVHVVGATDLLCYTLRSPDITAVRSGDGFKVVQTPEEANNTVVGPVTTTLAVTPPRSPWTYRIGIASLGTVTLGNGVTNVAGIAGQVQYDYHPLNIFIQGTIVGSGSGAGVLIFGGIQF